MVGTDGSNGVQTANEARWRQDAFGTKDRRARCADGARSHRPSYGLWGADLPKGRRHPDREREDLVARVGTGWVPGARKT